MISREIDHFRRQPQIITVGKPVILWPFERKTQIFHEKSMFFINPHENQRNIGVSASSRLFISLISRKKMKNTLISRKCPRFRNSAPISRSEGVLPNPDISRPSTSGAPEWLLGRAKNRSRVFWKCYGVSRELRFQKSEVFLSENEFPTRNRSF